MSRFLACAVAMLIAVGMAGANAQESGGVQINADAKNIVNTATGGGTAVTRVGTTTGGNVRIDAHVDGSVTTKAAMGNTARTDIGSSKGNTRTSVDVSGSVVTDGRTRDAGTYIGSTTSEVGRAASTNVHVSGSVMNMGGNLTVGGNGPCEGFRDGKCCLEFYLRRCVIARHPKPPNSGCAPGFIYSLGWCRMLSDYSHAVSE